MSEDLSKMIQDFLGSKEGQEKLQSVMSMFGSGGEDSPTDLAPKQETPDLNGLDLNTLMKVQQMMSGLSRNDKNTELLLALKPHLRPERQAKADDAIRIMRLLSMLPMLKESGLLGSLGNLGK